LVVQAIHHQRFAYSPHESLSRDNTCIHAPSISSRRPYHLTTTFHPPISRTPLQNVLKQLLAQFDSDRCTR
ncbi:9602_t:CDS:1, partial [Acaulospora colombiana]